MSGIVVLPMTEMEAACGKEKREGITISVSNEACTLHCGIIPMGDDIQLCIYGGDRAHIGSVVLAEPRESLTGEGISVTSSVLNRVGHKDEAVARRFAEAVAIHRKVCVCASCGIHLDDASPEQLQCIIELSEELLEKVTDI